MLISAPVKVRLAILLEIVPLILFILIFYIPSDIGLCGVGAYKSFTTPSTEIVAIFSPLVLSGVTITSVLCRLLIIL
jgi:hypothetical protein